MPGEAKDLVSQLLSRDGQRFFAGLRM